MGLPTSLDGRGVLFPLGFIHAECVFLLHAQILVYFALRMRKQGEACARRRHIVKDVNLLPGSDET